MYNRSIFKIQGSKFQLLPFIADSISDSYSSSDTWIEPFMGSGVVGINLAGERARFTDTNPYIIGFYNAVKVGKITYDKLEKALIKAQQEYFKNGGEHFYHLRHQFNQYKTPLRFFILNRTAYNGLIRFNKSGGYNAPYCKNDKKISDTLIERILIDFADLSDKINTRDWTFEVKDFMSALSQYEARTDVFSFMDPPYLGRNATYFKGWSSLNEKTLSQKCMKLNHNLLLTTWYNDKKRLNPYINKYWSELDLLKVPHRYIIAGSDKSVAIHEAFLSNRK